MTLVLGTMGKATPVARYWSVERRIVCAMCSGAKHTFKHDPEGLRLYVLHMALVHRVTISHAEKCEIANV